MKVIGPWAKETPFVRMATLDSSNLIYLSEDVLPFEWDEVVSLEKSKCLLGAFDPYWNFVVHAKSGSKRVRLTVDDPTKMLAWFAKSE